MNSLKQLNLLPKYSQAMLHRNGSGYMETEESAEVNFFKILGSGYVLEAYNYI